MTLQEFYSQEAYWSDKTFGPAGVRGPIGPLKHLQKEIKEILDAPDRANELEEYADAMHLIFDACRRAGHTYHELVEAVSIKFKKNQLRSWPDWRLANPEEAIEHDRSFNPVKVIKAEESGSTSSPVQNSALRLCFCKHEVVGHLEPEKGQAADNPIDLNDDKNYEIITVADGTERTCKFGFCPWCNHNCSAAHLSFGITTENQMDLDILGE